MHVKAEISPPFGTFALSEKAESWRTRALTQRDTAIGRAKISFFRKQALKGTEEPFDVTIEDDIKARLYPSDNRTDKRVFAGPQIWETIERKALESCVTNSSQPRFVFLDVGANTGIYSLYVDHYIKTYDKLGTILAIEPGLETCSRLQTNILASQADVHIIRAAVSNEPGSGFLGGGGENRGEAHLLSRSGSNTHAAERIIIDTLTRICRVQGITHINALKMDIEGHEKVALSGFFEDAPAALHPDLMIIETRHSEQATGVIELCLSYDYVVAESTRQNTIFKKIKHVQT